MSPNSRSSPGRRTERRGRATRITFGHSRPFESIFVRSAGSLAGHRRGERVLAALTLGDPANRWAGIPVVKHDTFNALGPFSDDPDAPIASELEFVVRKSENRGQFETPTLRNVERTAPYMHGGHFRTLEEVVEFYANLEPTPSVGQREGSLRPFELTERQKDDLVAFLKSLTGEPVPDRLTRQPDNPLPD